MSAQSQSGFLWLIRGELGFLLIAAAMSMDWGGGAGFFATYTAILLASLGVLIARSFWKPEQAWYRGRALAESIKTSCWRYCMRAEPFGDAPDEGVPLAEFREHLLEILRANRFIGDRMPPDSAAKEQVPSSMREVRALSLDQRKTYYTEHRIKEQRAWYATKAGRNRRASRFWTGIGIASYAVAISLALARIVYPEWKLWPIDPVLVFASAVLGWTRSRPGWWCRFVGSGADRARAHQIAL